jgi:hypothetical protein
MLTEAEIATLAALLERARHAAGRDHDALADTITPGDVVQLRPGASRTWDSSLLLVCQITSHGRVRGQILRPHRSGCREAWAEYSAPELARIGRAPYPEPPLNLRGWCRGPDCPLEQRKPPARAGRDHSPTLDDAQAIEREQHVAFLAALDEELRRLTAADAAAKAHRGRRR